MASVTYNGSIKTSDPRYQEGLSIMIPLGFGGLSQQKLKEEKQEQKRGEGNNKKQQS